ncbi:MAG: hypothetical protein KUG73_12010 [Pseudomonadales bacterium]|nr:hypothetical protein [Pseudomonadales bacterium]
MVTDPEHPFFGEVAPVYAALEKRYLRLTPSVPLLKNTEYAIVVTDAWQKKTGLCFDASPSMVRVSKGEISTSSARRVLMLCYPYLRKGRVDINNLTP